MEPLLASMIEYKKQMQKGDVIRAYRGLMAYMMDLRTHFAKLYPDYFISGSIYAGYMDMTYFAVSPPVFKQRNLKTAVVFVHEAFRFEVWLAGANKQVQSEYWKMIKESDWDKYRLVASPAGADAIIEQVLVQDPDFSDPSELTGQIEAGVQVFIHEVETFLASH